MLNGKQLKLPPIVNTTNGTILGGSTGNLTALAISNETTKIKSNKKKDLSKYCAFCQRKTGLASSYICR